MDGAYFATQLEYLKGNLTAADKVIQDDLTATKGSVDTFYFITVGALVFFMQAGFGMLEAGSVRTKNTRNILLKNLLDACIGALIWWAWGFAAAYETGDSPNKFIGGVSNAKGFFASGWVSDADNSDTSEHATGYTFALWFFQYVFAAAAATIVSGAVAERAQLMAYLIYSSVITGLIYPVVVHWVWDVNGWASAFNTNTGDAAPLMGGQIDFAGSGVVHMTGGVAALVGAAIIGPRSGRFEGGGRVGKPVPIKGHSSVLQVMGTFILWLGWYGFNPGSTLGITPSGYAMHASRSVVTTTLSAATGGVVVVILDKFLGSKTWDVGAVCNGILGGLVSITAGCSTVYPWAAVLIGFIGGGVYFGSSKLVLNVCKVDDPLDAFAVHGACGFWGCLATALLAAPAYAYAGSGTEDCDDKAGQGAFYGGGCLIGVAMAALIAEIAWVGGMSFILFFALKMSGLLRVSQDIEEMGMDVSKHGGTAYEMEGAAAKAAATSS